MQSAQLYCLWAWRWHVLFQIFIWIASAIRYWYFKYLDSKHKKHYAYDSIWFEKTATNWGYKYIALIEQEVIK